MRCCAQKMLPGITRAEQTLFRLPPPEIVERPELQRACEARKSDCLAMRDRCAVAQLRSYRYRLKGGVERANGHWVHVEHPVADGALTYTCEPKAACACVCYPFGRRCAPARETSTFIGETRRAVVGISSCAVPFQRRTIVKIVSYSVRICHGVASLGAFLEG
jgi:hypothetical protein